MDDRTLHQELACGNPAAFQQLVNSHQSRVINTCYGFVSNKEDAEDIAQEVFLEVYKSIDSFREDAKLSTWIYRICVTKSLDFLRKRKRKKRFGRFKDLFGKTQDRIEQIPAPATANPQKHLEKQERAEILQQAVDSLAENQKIAITLNKYEGFSYQEVAEIMGASVSSVESLLHRAKKNLEKTLYRYYAQQG
ncbi:MAG: sigma-70 family RNA polymerase sigma factor [bacterium]|nr:sigma-70 family RNA polymerase sigma factor [bacterium]